MIYLFFLAVIFLSALIFVLIKWYDEYCNRIAMEQEYDTLLERSIIVCDELAKAEELVTTQNKIINELQSKRVMKEEDGWTREMYPPKEEAHYLVKISGEDYYVYYFDGVKWPYSDVIAWREIPKTEIKTLF